MIFGKHRIPEIELMFNSFMLTDKEKSVKVFREWLCQVLTDMKVSLKDASDDNIANLGIKFIKPLLEFSSYHKDKLRYQNKSIDFNDKI